MSTKTVEIVTDSNGSFATDIPCAGQILAIALDIGTLSTPDLAITDKVTGASIFSKTAIASTARWQPKVEANGVDGAALAAAAGPPAVDNVYAAPIAFRGLHIAVTGGGDTVRGTLYIAYA